VANYVKQTWVDGDVSKPTSAARMGVIETGVFDAHFQPRVRVFHNASQSIGTAAYTVLAFNSERYDTVSGAASSMHDAVTNNSRLTALVAGGYRVSGNVEFAANATGLRGAEIRLNGATVIGRVAVGNAGAGDPTVLCVSADYEFAVNDYVELLVYQASGGALNVTVGGNYSPEFSMSRIG
jgi:hypothetical protein